MDYNVRYNIDINGAQASKSISDFQNTIQKTIPPIISSLETLRKELGKINSAFVNFNRIIGTKPKKIKYTIDGSIKKELKSLQSQINAIKGKTVTINTKINQTTSTTSHLLQVFRQGKRGTCQLHELHIGTVKTFGKNPCPSSCGFKKIAHSAGDKVNAFKAEKPIEIAMVIPN